MTCGRRLVASFVLLTLVWGVVFNLETLPFFPVVVAGALLTGAAGVSVRRACQDGWLPPVRVSPRHAALAVGVALVHVGLSHVLFAVGDALLPAIGETAAGVYRRTTETGVLPRLVLSGLVVAPLEEVFWRGAFHPVAADRAIPRVRRLPPTVVAVAVSTAGYTLFHVATLRVSLVAAAALGGLVWAWLAEHTRSLGAPVIAHGLWTALLVLFPVVQ